MEPGCEEYCDREVDETQCKEAGSTSTSASDGTTHRRDSWPVAVDPIKTQPFGDPSRVRLRPDREDHQPRPDLTADLRGAAART